MRTVIVSTNGMQISGFDRSAGEIAAIKDAPLIVALHGGSHTATYFDVPGYSLLERSAAVNIPIIALDRPGYGDSTPLVSADASIARNAEVLDEAIGKMWQERGAGRDVVLIGHSIGGEITNAIAARRPTWPLCGIAISGVGLLAPRQLEIQTAALPDIPLITRPSPMKDAAMFGPPWTYDDVMPQASHIADAPVPRREIIDITSWWSKKVRALAAAVTVPVHYRQAEFRFGSTKPRTLRHLEPRSPARPPSTPNALRRADIASISIG
jgi:pimeloyl-ACP methyl ester carboxylesterase